MPSLGPFRVGELLGVGGMAKVYRGFHDETQTEVALKVLTKASRSYAKLFQTEMAALARLDHPHITWTFDGGLAEAGESEAKGTPWLAMELAEAALDERMPESFATLVVVLEAVLGALAHAHAREVLHRDIKPGNLLWHADGRVMLADFGISDPTVKAGTPGFAPPEQLTGGTQGPWTDLYALGRTMQVLAPPEMGVPRWFWTFLQPMLQPDPRLRYASVAEAISMLQAGLAGTLPATDDEPAFPNLGAASSPTMVFSDETQSASGVPAHWNPTPNSDPSMSHDWRLHGAALGLADLRKPGFVGRHAIRKRLWDAFRKSPSQCNILLIGKRGHGLQRLVDWLQISAHEQGLLVPHGEEFGQGPAAIAWLFSDDCTVKQEFEAKAWAKQIVVVPPLPVAGIRTVVRGSLGLAPGEAGLIAELAQGNVQWCRQVTSRLGRDRKHLTWTPDGYEVSLDALANAMAPIPPGTNPGRSLFAAVLKQDWTAVEEQLNPRVAANEWASRWYLRAQGPPRGSAGQRVKLIWLTSLQNRQPQMKAKSARALMDACLADGERDHAFSALLMAAHALGQLGRDEEAIDLLLSWNLSMGRHKQARIFNQLSALLAAVGRHNEAEDTAAHALKLGADNPAWCLNVHLTRCHNLLLADKPADVVDAVAPARQAVDEGSTHWTSVVHAYMGQAKLAMGQTAAAREHILAALEEHLAAGRSTSSAVSKLNLALCDVAESNWMAVRRRVQPARRAFHHAGLEHLAAMADLVDSLASLELEDEPQAAAALRRCAPILSTRHPQPDIVRLSQRLAQTAIRKGARMQTAALRLEAAITHRKQP